MSRANHPKALTGIDFPLRMGAQTAAIVSDFGPECPGSDNPPTSAGTLFVS
jgi:hypothetical protein